MDATAALRDVLSDAYKPGRRVLLRPGRRVATGFDFGLGEREFYNVYAYYFYNNEWLERMIDTYYVYDLDQGDHVFRVNEDGFKSEQRQRCLAVHHVECGLQLDLCVQVHECQPSPAPTSLRDYRMHYMLQPNAQRVAVEEITLKYNDCFELALQKRFNLQSKTTAYVAFVRVSTPSVAPDGVLLPGAELLLRMHREIAMVLDHTRDGGEVDAQAVERIANGAKLIL